MSIPVALKTETCSPAALTSCDFCKKDIGLTRWESWNGFLVRCPYCSCVNGMPWKTKTVVLASFLFQPFSFFVTMRFRRAMIAFTIYLVVSIAGAYLMQREILPQIMEVFGVVLFLFVPILINAVVLLKHNSSIRRRNDNSENIADLLDGVRDLVG